MGKKPSGRKSDRRVTRPSDVDALANGRDVWIENGKGSHKKLKYEKRNSDGALIKSGSVTYYDDGRDSEYPAGTAAMLTRILKGAGLLLLLADRKSVV